MFYTHPALERSSLGAAPGSATQAWRIVTRISMAEWFYITHLQVSESASCPEPRMVQIDDGNEFQRFVNTAWSNTSISEIYLMSPAKTSDGRRVLTWRCELLLEMKRFSPGDDGRARYSYLTEFGSRFSASPDGGWAANGGELVYQHPDIYRKSQLIHERQAERNVRYAKQAIIWACELFSGDLRAAAQWLHNPLPELGNRAPCDMATADDERLLESVVSRLEQSMADEGGVHV